MQFAYKKALSLSVTLGVWTEKKLSVIPILFEFSDLNWIPAFAGMTNELEISNTISIRPVREGLLLKQKAVIKNLALI